VVVPELEAYVAKEFGEGFGSELSIEAAGIGQDPDPGVGKGLRLQACGRTRRVKGDAKGTYAQNGDRTWPVLPDLSP